MASIHNRLADIGDSADTIAAKARELDGLIEKLQDDFETEKLDALTEISEEISRASQSIEHHKESIEDEVAGSWIADEVNARERDLDDAFEAAVACKHGRTDGGYRLVAFFQEHFSQYQGAEVTFKGLAAMRPADYWRY